MLANDHGITIKSNSNSTKESDNSYVKITDDIEVLTSNKNVSHTPTTKATTVAASSTSSSSNTFGKNWSMPAVQVPPALSKDEERLESSLSDILSGTWA